jgi:NTP pyrophosphatase (non-canonical NTP hydrolase)
MKNNEKEILLITQEECAEVTQAISKVFRFGIDGVHKGVSNREHLTEELGDLLAMITLCHDYGIVSFTEVMIAKDNKLDKLRQWSDIFKVENND